jgi:hypothetical protein
MRIAFFGDSLTAGIPGCSYLAILHQRLPDDTLINLGRGNDTVVSLYHRVAGLPLYDLFDVAFLWIGVNDVAGTAWWPYQVFNALLG